ncbi:hypothetical protein [Bythopirellula polymerisocia]|uniref:Uncharacterized protein n=1 Tax=Bythopirellula polymerisocia TaxID=2528003 RepID=A0A5C6CR59_9BACT|nr:hypothetical protein [Bythopirellula polymerisocia]TWU25596.1 hypothetical protein Pla144_28030 [Bythopirellula polymerisocia]
MINQKNLLSCLTACVATTVLVVTLLGFSNAQEQTKEGSKQPSSQAEGGGFGIGFGFGGGEGGGGGFGGTLADDLMGCAPAIAANDKYIFVVHNNTLYQFAAEDLTAIKSVPLEASVEAAD